MEAAEGTRAAEQSIQKVTDCTQSTKNATDEVLNASDELGRQASELQSKERHFPEPIRTA